MRFRLIADAVFEADNIDDALRVLEVHFRNTRAEVETQTFLPDSSVEIRPETVTEVRSYQTISFQGELGAKLIKGKPDGE